MSEETSQPAAPAGPSPSEIFDFLSSLTGQVVQGVGSVVSASNNTVTTADGQTYQASPTQQGGETVIVLEDRSGGQSYNNMLLTYGLLGAAALLLLRR
jgi:hypothetical protein